MESLFTSPEFQMSLLLFVALGGYLIASRINQSAVVGLILVGLLVGPSLLGLITYTDFIRSLAHLGAVVLLFVIGLEFNLKDILSARNGIIAGIGVIVPWIGGFWLSLLFGFDMASAIFIGTALTATSIAITANVLKELGKLQTEAAKAIIGAAVIDDVLSLLALAISSDVVSGTFSVSGVLIVALKAIAFIVIAGAFGLLVVSRFFERLDTTSFVEKYPEFIFIFAMMMAFLYALLAEVVGLSAIVGAFIAGVSFEGVHLRRSRSLKEGADYLQIIFASIFFVSLGILADFHALTMEIVVFLLVLTIVAIVTKVIGCGIPARLAGLCSKDALIVGFGMAPRGEVAMIVALIGLEAGIIGQGVYVTLVLMSLLTTLITPIIYRNWLYRGEYCGYNDKGVAISESQDPGNGDAFMTFERKVAQLFMMDDTTWIRHANPWSGILRNTALPLLIIAFWSRLWLGWWAVIPVALALLWTWLNPRIFPAPKSLDHWMSKAVLGERVWLNRDAVPVPAYHTKVPNVLSAVAAIGLFFILWGILVFDLCSTLFGTMMAYLGKLWFADRMVWLWNDMQDAAPQYRSWQIHNKE